MSERVSPSRIQHLVAGFRSDRLYRTSFLLILDNLTLGVLGGVFTLLAAHRWSPHSIGVVAAVGGALSLILTASSMGMPSTIVGHLAKEPDQALLVRAALTATIPVGLVGLGVLWIAPGHLGVPLGRIGLEPAAVLALTAVYVVANLIVMLSDPAFIARQEASWILGKDMAAMAVRFLALLIAAGSGTAGLYVVAVVYVVFGGTLDLVLVRWRLRRQARPKFTFGTELLRSKFRFAAGSQAAVLASMVPTTLLPVIVLNKLGPASAAFVAIPMQILGALTVVSSMTAQSLFAELSAFPGHALVPVRKALRAAYLFTLPIAGVVIVVAPFVLGLFGHRYQVNGVAFLRWGAASSIFYCLNYITDIVFLAHRKVAAYVFVNLVGAGGVLVCIVVSVERGISALGLGWFIGQAWYCAVSVVTMVFVVGWRDLAAILRGRPDRTDDTDRS